MLFKKKGEGGIRCWEREEPSSNARTVFFIGKRIAVISPREGEGPGRLNASPNLSPEISCWVNWEGVQQTELILLTIAKRGEEKSKGSPYPIYLDCFIILSE